MAARDLPEARHKSELDGIRGIAILAVLLSHAGPLIQNSNLAGRLLTHVLIPGWAGVDLFFVLSGFLITGILLRTKTTTNYFSSFYMRRFLRIFPIYYLVLIIGLSIAWFEPWWNSILPRLTMTRAAYFFYVQNWPVFWDQWQVPGGVFGHFWSLAVEEQFYLIWPFVIWLLPEKLILRLCVAGMVAALALRILLIHKLGFGVMVLTGCRIDGLFIGSALAISAKNGPISKSSLYALLGVGCAAIGYITLFHLKELIATDVYMHTIGVTGFACLSGALLGFSQYHLRPLQRVLDMGWLRTAGKYSYGMYVYHLPIYFVSNRVLDRILSVRTPLPVTMALPYMAALIVATFFIAKLSFDLFESKILSLKKYFRPHVALTDKTPAILPVAQ